MSPQGARLLVPGHSKLCEQNMGWEASQPGPVPGGSPAPHSSHPWAGGGGGEEGGEGGGERGRWSSGDRLNMPTRKSA